MNGPNSFSKAAGGLAAPRPPKTFGHRAVRNFLAWAEETRCSPGAARLALIAGDLGNPVLLGALAAFVARAPALDLFAVWRLESTAVGAVHDLALRTWASPDSRAGLPVVNPGQRLEESLRGFLAAAPVAAMCSAGQPSLGVAARAWIDTLRAFVLAVSLGYAEVGNPADRHVATVARYLRRACDDPYASNLLKWFLHLQGEGRSLAAVSELIVERCSTGRNDSVPAVLVTALKAMALRRELPGPGSGELPPLPPIEEDDGQRQPFETLVAAEDAEILAEPGEEEGVAMAAVDVLPDQTPDQSARMVKGVLMETLETLQFLPYGWQRLNPYELNALGDFVASLADSKQPDDRLLAAFVAVAHMTNRSLETVGSIPLGADAGTDWSLDVERGTLQRLPSRRASRWSAQNDAALSWVRPLAAAWLVRLETRLRNALAKAARGSKATSLVELWSLDISPERAFNAACRCHPLLHRVSSGLVRRSAQTALFAEKADGVFARLATASSNSALPGACAYPSWRSEEMRDVWARAIPASWIERTDFGAANHNALGSELDPMETLLAASIQKLWARLCDEAREPEHWVQHHNTLTGYVVVALLTATGARPVDSPFESPAHFDWSQGFVFLDDKAASYAGSGRPVPLPKAVFALLDHYRNHLANLASVLGASAPDFAAEVEKLSRRATSALPFFFFVRAQPTFDWLTVSPASLDALRLADWPLPWNLMRHRLATRLRGERVDPEIIDGLFGHSEAGTESWGDTSLRSWREDARHVRPALDRVYRALNFDLPPLAMVKPALSITVDRTRPLLESRGVFGSAARRQQRTHEHERARKQASATIDSALGERPWSSLSAEEIEALGRSMILTEKGMPHSYADVRYAVFEQRLGAAWRNEGKRPRLRKRFAFARGGTSPFAPECAGAIGAAEELRAAVAAGGQVAEKAGSRVVALLAALNVCSLTRVSDLRVLHAILVRKDIAIVVQSNMAWIEYRANQARFPDQPAPRFPVTPQAALWIDRTLSTPAGGAPLSAIPDALRPLADRVLPNQEQSSLNPVALLEAVASQVRQANALELPGVIAAYLDGRVPSWGAPHADWLRFVHGAAYQVAPSQEDLKAAKGVNAERVPDSQSVIAVAPGVATDFDARIDLAKELLAAMRSRLTDYGRMTPRGQEDTAARRDLRRELTRVVRTAGPRTPSAIRMLAAWVVQLLERRPTKPHFLKPSSIERYLDALAPRFLDHAHDVDLAELDSEDLSELYGAMLQTALEEGLQAEYIEQRLREFHRYASEVYGLDEPDWNEVGVEGAAAMGAPGLVLEVEYLFALRRLVPDIAAAGREALCAAMMLLLSFRFGLRGREAYGLLRSDWADCFETLVVLVRSNGLRALKTLSAQRQVPLLANLTAEERMLIQRWLATWDVVAEANESVPLFALDRAGALPSLRTMRERVRDALRQACCASHITVHHCRHSFACELFFALAPRAMRPDVATSRWMDPKHVQQLLVGSTHSTRRALWAAARALGHARPTTTLKSYVHVLPDAVNVILATRSEGWQLGNARLAHAIDLDSLRTDPGYLRAGPEFQAKERRPPTLSNLVQAAQLLARDQSADNAAFALNLDTGVVHRLRDWFNATSHRLMRSARASPTDPKPVTPPQLLRQVLRKRWKDLEALAAVASTPVACGLDPARALRQVGPARQVILWRPEHFPVMADFIATLRLQGDVVLYETDGLAEDVRRWADASGLTDRRTQRNEEGVRVFQIDGVTDASPPQRVMHRCAAARAPDSARLRSNAELLVLWSCYSIAASLSVRAQPTA